MAIFEITEGAPGQGKSLYFAKKAYDLLKRNKKWHDKGHPIRKIWSNIRFSEEFEKEWGDYIHYWVDTQEVCKMRDADLLWDEIATELDSRNFANLTVELKRFLSQYRKRGVDIYGNTQDFSMVDRRARLMITGCKTLTKIIGSGDPSPTKPEIKNIWGLTMIRDVINYKEDDPEKKKYNFVPSFMFIERKYVDIYDTRQDIPMGKPAPLRHIELRCEHEDHPLKPCKVLKIVHS
jgi:hypothetical protein